jgi:uncharacterized protein (DUF433 family)
MSMRTLVSSAEQAAANILKFVEELPKSPDMQSRLGRVHDWYALRLAEGAWAFAPSKFVGYQENTTKKYLETYRTKANGGETEQALRPLSSAVEEGSRLAVELMSALEEYLAQWGRRPRRPNQIRVVSTNKADLGMSRVHQVDETVLARISSDPRICGGRPCIKGTRMRVTDIVEALAHGATREQLLRDFDYLSDEDLSAALIYAARASDHRVIRAA